MSKETTDCWKCGYTIEYNSKSLIDLIRGNLPKLEGKLPMLEGRGFVIANLDDIETKLHNHFEQFGQQQTIVGQQTKLIFPCPNCGELNKED